jgi:hypothetical protein
LIAAVTMAIRALTFLSSSEGIRGPSMGAFIVENDEWRMTGSNLGSWSVKLRLGVRGGFRSLCHHVAQGHQPGRVGWFVSLRGRLRRPVQKGVRNPARDKTAATEACKNGQEVAALINPNGARCFGFNFSKADPATVSFCPVVRASQQARGGRSAESGCRICQRLGGREGKPIGTY